MLTDRLIDKLIDKSIKVMNILYCAYIYPTQPESEYVCTGSLDRSEYDLCKMQWWR